MCVCIGWGSAGDKMWLNDEKGDFSFQSNGTPSLNKKREIIDFILDGWAVT
jgi:hypothetical protein